MPASKPTRPLYVLTDIEGTTTPITFVHDVLFPYSAERLPSFVRSHADDAVVRQCLTDTGASGDEAAIQLLLQWIAEDRKYPALKTLQGLIWRDGYESKAYTAKVYDDVPTWLRTWRERGIELGVYSSGSVAAQKLLFKYSDHGDLTPLFSHYFDTAVGGKREPDAYRAITAALKRPAADILFLSDIVEELDAARTAGMTTAQLLRPGNKSALAPERHPVCNDFGAVEKASF